MKQCLFSKISYLGNGVSRADVSMIFKTVFFLAGFLEGGYCSFDGCCHIM